ncbi:hypothetical protein ACP70R_015217 [Stipagrostis hirtigluma subsp. patula]
MAPPPPSRRRRTTPALMEEAIGEILLRIPPDDPACLVRASVVCKAWRRLLVDPAFPGRYRAFHRKPPMLGFFRDPTERQLARFVPTSSFRPAAAADQSQSTVIDCRHGRVLLYDCNVRGFVVWDPITGNQHLIPDRMVPGCYYYGAIVCAAGTGCDHSSCASKGPFVVAFVGWEKLDSMVDARACCYSSETGALDVDDTYIHLDYSKKIQVFYGPALVGDALYFIVKCGILLKYELSRRNLSVIKAPDVHRKSSNLIMMAEDGGLGFASLYRHSLSLWSRETGPNGDAGWAQRRVIDLEMLLPVANRKCPSYLSGIVEGANVFLVSTDDGVYIVELESLRSRKVGEKENSGRVFPYVSFHIPGLCGRNTVISCADSVTFYETLEDIAWQMELMEKSITYS